MYDRQFLVIFSVELADEGLTMITIIPHQLSSHHML
jgi:hypothetical protein